MTAISTLDDALVLTLSAETSNPFDAAIRVLGDAQRYGFFLENLAISKSLEGGSTLRLDLWVPPDCDIANIRDRFSRHAALSRLTVRAA